MLNAYDPQSALSIRVPVAHQVRDALAGSPAFARLIDNPARAAEHVEIGFSIDPWGESTATPSDLEAMLCRAFIVPDEEPLLVADSTLSSACPVTTAPLLVRIRRQIRAAERSALTMPGVYLAIWDCCDAIGYDLTNALRSSWPGVSVTVGTVMAAGANQSAGQGLHVVCDIRVSVSNDSEAK